MNTEKTEKLKLSFEQLGKVRGKNRITLLNDIVLLASEVLKSEYTSFTREQINFFLSDSLPKSTKFKVMNEVLKPLIDNGTIKEEVVNRELSYFIRDNLSSNDYGSYQKIMEKNGYKRNLYNYGYNKTEGYPFKKKIASLKLHEEINKDFDESELKSYLPQEKQGVYANSSKSWKKRTFHKPFTFYTFI